MASVLALRQIISEKSSNICRFAYRRTSEDGRLLLKPGRTSLRPDDVRRQSTQTYSQPTQQHKKRRSKKTSTIDVIQVKEQHVSEGQAKVTRLNQHSFEQTIGHLSATVPPAISSTILPTSSIAQGTGTLPLEHSTSVMTSGALSEVPVNKFSDLINAQLEKTLRTTDFSEAVRWHDGVTHTYDASFMFAGDVLETQHWLSDQDVIKDSREKSRLEVEEVLEMSENDLSSLLSPLAGFSHLEAEEARQQISKHVKKKGSGGKKKTKSTKKKPLSESSVNDVMPLCQEEASKKTKKAVTKEQFIEEEDMFIDRDSYKDMTEEDAIMSALNSQEYQEEVMEETQDVKVAKKKKGKKEKRNEELKKHLEEIKRKGREESFNQTLEAYLNVCINVGMLNRAMHTLLYYRRLSKYARGSKVSSIGPYNVLLQGFAERGNYSKMEELLRCLREDNIKPEMVTYGAMLNCLGRQPESPSNTRSIEDILSDIVTEGKKIQELFGEVDFVRDGYHYALQAVKRASPTFEPWHTGPSVEYNCNLVNSLNEGLYSNEITSPAKGLASKQLLHQWAEEQFKLELSGEITIESIQKKAVNEHVHFFRRKLESWEGRWREALYRAFVDQVEAMKQAFFANRREKRMTLYPYLVTLPVDEFVNIMMQEITRLAGGSEAFSPSRYVLYRRLGDIVYSRYLVQHKKDTGHMNKLKKVYTQYCDWYLDPKGKSNTAYIPRVGWSDLAMRHKEGPRLDHNTVEWPNPILLAIGQFLYNILMTKVMVWKPLPSEKHAYPAFYEVERSYGYRVVEEVKPSPTLLDLYRKASKPTLTFEAFVAPMVSPPIPWMSPKLGGYLLTESKIVRLPFNAHQQKQRMEECGNQQLYPVMDSLNQLGSIPWQVNKPMVDLLIQIFNDKGWYEMDVPPPPSEQPVPAKITPGMSSAEVAQVRRQRMDYYKKKNEMHSLWCDALYKLSLANHFRDRIFWFPHNMDFRGRVYPCPPHLNHLSSDVFRSILHFARGEKLGPNGLWWLKLHLINLTGMVKKKSVTERLEYCDEVMDDILDSADNPLDGRRWWTQSDEPWQTLAACKELAAAIRSGNPEEFVNHLPIHQDGSCNGLQHYAALGRDDAGAVSVNLASSKVPQDVYSAVAALVEEERQKDADAGKEIAKTLDGFVRRKVIKQTVMTTVYGVTRYGARLQIEKQLKALDEFPSEQRWAASQYLVQKTFHSLEQMFTATKDIQDWFTECARMIAQIRCENIEWVTPLGFPVVQPYSKMAGNKASYLKLPTSFTMDSFMRPNVMKQKNAFPPNFIHSLDSSHMMLTALFCQRAGITYVSVHDCFWTHAATVDIMNRVCRDQFVALHKEPILEDLSVLLKDKFGYQLSDFAHDGSASDSAKMKLNNLLSRVPPKGDFDISNVLKSTFFFS